MTFIIALPSPRRFVLPLITIGALAIGALALAPEEAPAADAPPALPTRLLDCTLGHALNLDPGKFQTIDEIKYEGAHRFALQLAPAAAWHGPPPDPGADPEPVDPATRIVADPSGLAADMQQPLARVVDMWPERVEMIGAIPGQPQFRLIVLSEIDLVAGKANLFMTRAADAASLDLTSVYQGGCTITVQPDT